MAEQFAQTANAATPPPTATPPEVKLRVKTGSRLGPLLLLAIMVLVFVLLSRQAGLEQLMTNVGLTPEAGQPLDFQTVTKQIFADENKATVKEAVEGMDGLGDKISKIAIPLGTGYLEQLIDDFFGIIASVFSTAWQLGLYALLPGIAGLIYRRAFWTWFLAAFAILFAINFSGKVSLTGANQMPLSGAIFLFLLAQVVLLLLANRLQRYSNNPGPIPPYIYNTVLAAILLVVAIACYEGWGPGDGETSWIWSFFGTGFSGFVYKYEFILIGLPALYILLRNSEHWTGQEPKNIVVCLDGTSNTPEQQERGLMAQTNVFKLFKMLKADKQTAFVPTEFDASLCKKYEKKQIAFYYVGVGNKYDSDPLTQTLGMAAGLGAAGAVERAYLDVMRVYRPGDRVFIFGFSRGAAISRLLSRVIDHRGAPKTVWTIRLFGRHWTVWQSGQKQNVPINVLGCWDTVGAFGIAKTIAGINFQKLNMFRDLSVPENVERAYHMVALDEMRDSFEPTLMDPDPIMPERITEVWFAGDHANIGGGWATDRLSDVTMDFLLQHVSSGYASDETKQPGNENWGLYLSAVNGLKVHNGNPNPDGVPTIFPNPLGQLRSWSSVLYEYRPRQLPLHAVISETVFERMARAIPVYAPQSLFNLNEDLDNKRDSIDAHVHKLAETDSLTQEEREAVINAKNQLHLIRWPQYLRNLYARRPVAPAEQRLTNAIPEIPDIPETTADAPIDLQTLNLRAADKVRPQNEPQMA